MFSMQISLVRIDLIACALLLTGRMYNFNGNNFFPLYFATARNVCGSGFVFQCNLVSVITIQNVKPQ